MLSVVCVDWCAALQPWYLEDCRTAQLWCCHACALTGVLCGSSARLLGGLHSCRRVTHQSPPADDTGLLEGWPLFFLGAWQGGFWVLGGFTSSNLRGFGALLPLCRAPATPCLRGCAAHHCSGFWVSGGQPPEPWRVWGHCFPSCRVSATPRLGTALRSTVHTGYGVCCRTPAVIMGCPGALLRHLGGVLLNPCGTSLQRIPAASRGCAVEPLQHISLQRMPAASRGCAAKPLQHITTAHSCSV